MSRNRFQSEQIDPELFLLGKLASRPGQGFCIRTPERSSVPLSSTFIEKGLASLTGDCVRDCWSQPTQLLGDDSKTRDDFHIGHLLPNAILITFALAQHGAVPEGAARPMDLDECSISFYFHEAFGSAGWVQWEVVSHRPLSPAGEIRNVKFNYFKKRMNDAYLDTQIKKSVKDAAILDLGSGDGGETKLMVKMGRKKLLQRRSFNFPVKKKRNGKGWAGGGSGEKRHKERE
uniref:Uncharacterized protein n=1 Tax=Daphnia galeata TaxID=27404 RepID=A0A8J2W7S9_9CRUS|nr:unnamed protein product [Daphnia galeata]